jgi:hypothetical protein
MVHPACLPAQVAYIRWANHGEVVQLLVAANRCSTRLRWLELMMNNLASRHNKDEIKFPRTFIDPNYEMLVIFRVQLN